MSTIQDKIVNESTLKKYDIKLRDWVVDEISAVNVTENVLVTINPSEWVDKTVVKNINISDKFDIIISVPSNDLDNAKNAVKNGIFVTEHDGTSITITYLNSKPTTIIKLQVTALTHKL